MNDLYRMATLVHGDRNNTLPKRVVANEASNYESSQKSSFRSQLIVSQLPSCESGAAGTSEDRLSVRQQLMFQ